MNNIVTFEEYLAFFERWLNYQFSRLEDEDSNNEVLQRVARLVSDPDELKYWSNRSNWDTYKIAKDMG